MASFGTEFHALENELADFIEGWMETHHVYATILAFFPFRTVPLTQETIRDEVTKPRHAHVMFTLSKPDLSETSQLALIDKNPGSLFLNIGRLGPRGLEQSSLSTLDANDTWKQINKDLKRRTTAGSDYIHEENGVRGHQRNFRFTSGAKALSKSGTALRQYAQMAVVYYPK